MKYYIRTMIYSVLLLVVFVATPVYAGQASLFLSKSQATVSEGENITIDIRVKSPDQAINAVTGSIIFPNDLLQLVSISRDNSIFNIWAPDPNISRNKISFEGVITTPGYQGVGGDILHITFKAKKVGTATVSFNEGSLLANDGLGTNILNGFGSTSFNIIAAGALDLVRPIASTDNNGRLLALPVITEYSESVFSKDSVYLRGKGEPNALTKLSFEEVSKKSFGEQFMDFIQSKKKRLTDVLVKNNDRGLFEYITPNNLVAGVYNATPFLVDDSTNTSKPGLGVRLFVSDSKIIKALIVFINILILLIPIVGLIMLIYFIPWYSSRRMRILKRKMGLEEEKIQLTEHELERQDKILSQAPIPPITTEKRE